MGRPLRFAWRPDANCDLVVIFHSAYRCGASGVVLLGVRFLFGAGEAWRTPQCRTRPAPWFPESSRAEGAGLCDNGDDDRRGRGAARRTMVDQWGRLAVVVRGLRLLGVIWAISFYLWFRDNPADTGYQLWPSSD